MIKWDDTVPLFFADLAGSRGHHLIHIVVGLSCEGNDVSEVVFAEQIEIIDKNSSFSLWWCGGAFLNIVGVPAVFARARFPAWAMVMCDMKTSMDEIISDRAIYQDEEEISKLECRKINSNSLGVGSEQWR